MSLPLAVFIVLLRIVILQPGDNHLSLLWLLPADSEMNGWYLFDTAEYDSISDLPDNWCDLTGIYTEYGLNKLLVVKYRDINNQVVNVEIYHMNDNSGAYGLYSISQKTRGGQAGYGDESFQDRGLVYFWKGNYHVRIYSDTGSSENQEIIFQIAASVNKKIEDEGIRPEIIELLPDESFVTERTRYFMGNEGLGLYLSLDHGDISGFTEGVFSDFGTYQLFLFKYENTNEQEIWFDKITGNLTNYRNYVELSENDNGYIFTDQEGNSIVFGSTGRYIMIFIGRDIARQPEIFERIEDASFENHTEIPG